MFSGEIVPPAGPLPQIEFTNGDDALEGPARLAALQSAWAARRWNVPALLVPGLPAGERPSVADANLSTRRGLAIATVLEAQRVRALPAPASGPSVRLAIPGLP